MSLRKNRWLFVSILFGIAFALFGPMVPAGPLHMAFKGAAVATLALYTFERSTSVSRPIGMVLVFGALGDILIEIDLSLGALAFLAGHCFACWFYITNRRRLAWYDGVYVVMVLAAIPALTSVILPDQAGVLAYSFSLAAMVASAWCSRFRRDLVALGAALFAMSDLLLFAHLGLLSGKPFVDLLVWPLYYAGQALIAVGVVLRVQLMLTALAASRASA